MIQLEMVFKSNGDLKVASTRVLFVEPTETLYIKLPAQVYAALQISLSQG